MRYTLICGGITTPPQGESVMCTFEAYRLHVKGGYWAVRRDGRRYGTYLSKKLAEDDARNAAGDRLLLGEAAEVLVLNEKRQPFCIFSTS